jgi:hypothetical protein
MRTPLVGKMLQRTCRKMTRMTKFGSAKTHFVANILRSSETRDQVRLVRYTSHAVRLHGRRLCHLQRETVVSTLQVLSPDTSEHSALKVD